MKGHLGVRRKDCAMAKVEQMEESVVILEQVGL
jgi:hypothetical protein